MDQRTGVVVVVVVVILAIVAIVGWLYSRQRRTKLLRQRFGPEYDRVVREEGEQRKGEAVLEFRAKRRHSLHIHPLQPEQQSAFATRWIAVQSRFVDDPRGAVTDADLLINEVMAARGYPMTDFEQRAADISVDHPRLVEDYRIAHGIAAGQQRGGSATEDLRKAMVHYRSLFEDLLDYSTANRKERMA
jgi:hypothetical protein